MLFCYSIIYSQNEEFNPSDNGLEIVNTAGGDAITSEGSVAYSIGTIFYETLKASDLSVSQGAQQAEKDQIQESDEVKIVIYPNPTVDSTIIDIANFNNEFAFYQLFDQHGRQLESNLIISQTTKVIMNYRSSSIYFLTVVISNEVAKSFKIIKN